MTFEIPILRNSYFDLSKFDFSFIDITIYNIQSEQFAEYVRSLNPDFFGGNFSFFKQIILRINEEYDQRYAIVKNDHRNGYDSENLENVYKLLLVIFPSLLRIEHVINFKDEDNFIQRAYMTTLKERDDDESGGYLYCDEELLPEVNNYLKIVFSRLKSKSYIGLSIENYLTSYSASHLHFEYITLCMSLENLIYGSIELSYRLKRSVAILCGKSHKDSERIFKNLDAIYTLRSKVVHGDKYDENKMFDFLRYLQSIVSLTITELLIHNIENNTELNKSITSLGFGQRNLISENWKEFILNPLVNKELCVDLKY